MRKFLLFLFLFNFIFIQESNCQETFATRIDEFMQAKTRLNNFNGAILLARNDSILIEKAYGLADREWNVATTSDTKFRIASITKQFTAVCILQLEEHGKIKLTDTLGKFIPGFKYGNVVTINMLLTHSSGLQEYSSYPPLNDVRPISFTRDSMVELFKSRPFDFYPGKGLNYSNTGYYLLGIVIEKASGESYADYLSNHIFKVLGMVNSGFEVSGDSIIPKRARGYVRYPSGTYNAFDENYRQGWGYADGNIYSTVGDLYIFEKALKGNTLLSDAAKKKMSTQYGYSIVLTKEDTAKVVDPFWMHAGYGVFIDTLWGHKRYLTAGGKSGFRSAKYNLPDNNICVIVLTNMEDNLFQLTDELTAILLGNDFSTPYTHTSTKIDARVLTKYIGKWKGKGAANDITQEHVFEIVIKDNKLYRRKPENKPPPNNFHDQELIPESETRFFYGDGQDKVFDFSTIGTEKTNYIWFIKNGLKFRWEKL